MRGTPGRGSGNRLLRALALAALLPVFLAGCGGGGTNGGGSGSTASPTPAPAPVLSASAALPDGLTATLAQNTATVPVGGSVTYTLTLTNNTSQPITYVGIGGDTTAVGDYLQIVGPSGQTVLPQSNMGGNNSVVATLPLTLAPGQSSSGTIAAVGVFATAGRYAATATFRVGPASGTATTAVGPLTVTVQ